MRTIYVKPGTKVVVRDTTDRKGKIIIRNGIETVISNEELEILRTENAILKKKLEEIKVLLM